MSEHTGSYDLGSPRAQHERLVAQSAVVMRLGLLLMKSGASAYRVKSSMARLARAVGLAEHHAHLTFTEISTTSYAQGAYRTEIAETRIKGINAYRIDLLGEFVSALPTSIEPKVANATLGTIESTPSLYRPWLLALASALACAGFAFLNRGGWVECLTVLLAAGLGQLLRSTLAHRGMNHMAVWFMCGLLSTGLYVGAVQVLTALGTIQGNHLVGFISAVLYLVPGFPLVTGLLDIARMDFTAGISRLTYVILLLTSAAFAVWLVALVFGLPLAQAPLPDMAPWLLVTLRVLASFVAAYGFAMLFQATPASCLWAGLIAALVNPARLWLTELGWAPQLAVAVAVFTAGVLAEVVAPLYAWRISRVSLSVPAAVTMVPGVAFYMSMAHFSNGDVAAALDGFVQVVLTFVALGMGLAFARLLMDRDWLYDRDTQVLGSLPSGHTR